ncbi:hypothetical protein ACWGTI_11190 [Mesorhizobium sp. ArgA1]
MPEVTYEPMYELLKKIHSRMDRLENGLGEVKHEVVAIRLQALGTKADISDIYAITGRIDQRLERIEQRLELRELAEKSQPPYDPRP